MRSNIGKCRARSLDTGEWIYGSFYEVDGNAIILHQSRGNLMQHTAVDPETAGECAAVYDKHGNEIYEGDIIIASKHSDGSDNIVQRIGCSWVCFPFGSLESILPYSTIIGSIK